MAILYMNNHKTSNNTTGSNNNINNNNNSSSINNNNNNLMNMLNHNNKNNNTIKSHSFTSNFMKHSSDGGLFPDKLHDLLQYAEDNGLQSIVSWTHNGTAFTVHDSSLLTDRILPMFFAQTQYRSFQRQLNSWFFDRIQLGNGSACFRHPYFVQGRQSICQHMSRESFKREPLVKRCSTTTMSKGKSLSTGSLNSKTNKNTNNVTTTTTTNNNNNNNNAGMTMPRVSVSLPQLQQQQEQQQQQLQQQQQQPVMSSMMNINFFPIPLESVTLTFPSTTNRQPSTLPVLDMGSSSRSNTSQSNSSAHSSSSSSTDNSDISFDDDDDTLNPTRIFLEEPIPDPRGGGGGGVVAVNDSLWDNLSDSEMDHFETGDLVDFEGRRFHFVDLPLVL